MNRLSKFVSIIILMILIVSTAAGCGSGGKMAADQAAPESAADNKAGNTAEASLPRNDRKIIQNANITVNVSAIEDTVKDIEEKVNLLDGYVSDSSLNGSNGSKNGHLTVRIPSAQFTEFMQWLESNGKVQNKRVYTEDVTEEFIDLSARIENLKAQEKRLQQILSEAKTVDEILKVEKEMERVRGELESLTGRLKYLEDRLDFSTVNITLQESVTANSNLSASGFNDFFQRSRMAFINSTNTLLNGTGNMLVVFIGVTPLLLPLALIGLIIWILRKRLSIHNKNKIEK